MIQFNDFNKYFLLPFIISAVIFIVIMIILRALNFNTDGTRKVNWRNLSSQLLSEQVEYHNNAIYRAFEFYIKMILAIIGGIAFIAISKEPNIENAKVLVYFGGQIIYPITLLFSLLVLNHQKAKIERWIKSYKWYAVFMWNEFWFLTISISIAFALNNITIPILLKNL